MARLHEVQKAMKDYPKEGIKKGERYYWWQFRNENGRVHRSRTRPQPSQLTNSPFLSEALSIGEELTALTAADVLEDDFSFEEYCDRIRELGDQCSDSLSNMPDSLQMSPTGELLQQRADDCEQWASDLEAIDLDQPEQEDEESDEDYKERLGEWADEIVDQIVEYSGE